MEAIREGCETPMNAHPYAEIFPLNEGQPLWDLADDIKTNGQLEPIWTLDGQILDGRRRELACIRAQVKPWREKYKGDDPLTFVVSKNLHRRHLGEADRAKVAARIATMKQGGDRAKGSGDPFAPGDKPSVSIEKAAEMMNVSPKAVKRAKKVDAKGTEAVKQAVDDKTITLTDAAKLAAQPPEVQDAAVDKVRKGKAKTATEAAQVFSMEDDVGYEVPESLYPAFAAAAKIVGLCRELDKFIQRIEELGREPGGRMIHVPSHQQSLKAVRQSLFTSRPTHVCPYCKATKKECSSCKGQGWTTKLYFDQAPPDMRKAMEGGDV